MHHHRIPSPRVFIREPGSGLVFLRIQAAMIRPMQQAPAPAQPYTCRLTFFHVVLSDSPNLNGSAPLPCSHAMHVEQARILPGHSYASFTQTVGVVLIQADMIIACAFGACNACYVRVRVLVLV